MSDAVAGETLDAHEQHAVEEADELSALICSVVESSGQAAVAVHARFKQIIYKYQEQPELLDAQLEGLVVPLSALLRLQALDEHGLDVIRVISICRLLQTLTTVRGYKTVVRFFPHEAMDLERILSVLTEVNAVSKAPPSNLPFDDGNIAIWEAQSTLVLWLSILILIPFDLATVDTAAESPSVHSPQPYTSMVGTILNLCKEYLHHPAGVRDMAALLLGRLLTRPDMSGALSEFLGWAAQALAAAQDTITAPFLVPGIIATLAFVFKLGSRGKLLQHTARVWSLLGPMLDSPQLAGAAVARKLAIKLAQRLGTTFLPPRLAPWRYVRGGASLDQSLAAAGKVQEGAGDVGEDNDYDDDDDGGLESAESVEVVEALVERLLAALRDRDTIVRWSAAKGVGRITGCLPRELGEDIVGSVLELFRPTESDTAWHGGCLALAELARRGLLLPERLPVIVPFIQQALVYDVRRGPFSIGSHVRDAAAYVCWAAARAYDPATLADSVHVLAAALLTISCYDREVNCRRAASSAFQESVGRLGNFPHGIEILTVADYFSVGIITQAYTRVAPFVASFPEYRLPLALHLLSTKLRHWEKALRELAATGLAALVPTAPQFFATEALDMLVPLVVDPVLEVRHGAVVGVAELLPALDKAGVQLPQEQQHKVASILTTLEAQRMYRGKGGELMREAVCRLLECCSAVALPLNTAQRARAQDAMDEGLRHPLTTIRQAAVAAVKAYSRTYLSSAGDIADYQQHIVSYFSRLHDAVNVVARRGAATALGALPRPLLQPSADLIIAQLCLTTKVKDEAEAADIESRVAAVRALASVCTELFGGDPEVATQGAGTLQHQVLPVLVQAMADYTTDNRGDVGSLVREAAMEVSTPMLQLLCSCLPESSRAAPLSASTVSVVGALLRQAVERIARVRSTASTQLRKLLSDPQLSEVVPGASTVLQALPDSLGGLGERESLESLKRLAGLLELEQYRPQLIEGLVASIGCVDNAISQAAGGALVEVVERREGGALRAPLATALLAVWKVQPRSPRLATSFLRTAHLLLSRTGAGDVLTPDGPFLAQLLALVQGEVKKSGDVMRLVEGANVLCCVAGRGEPWRSDALQAVAALLVSKYPKVRRHTAEQLYLQVLAESDEGEGPSEAVEAAGDLLLATAWDGPLDEVRQARNELADLLLVPLTAKDRAGPSSASPAPKAHAAQASYQSLVDDAARGGGY